MALPQGFIDKYTALLGSDAPAFFASYDEPAGAGFRVNPLRPDYLNLNLDLHDPISYSKWGYRGKVDGNDIDHVSGYVYSQEPSAQVVGAVADARPGMRVLDLCAAPGGKSTHLASSMANTGLLVANEIHAGRAKILASNLERFGVRNAVITNTDPDSLAAVLPEFFDLILVDAPCSGEGMFRKDPEAIQYWHEDYAAECAKRQREILHAAWQMLRPGGTLVYSTCTFAPEEDEQIVAWLMEEYGMQIEPIALQAGMAPGHPEWANGNPELLGTTRMWPQNQRGEGHFCARLTKPETESTPSVNKKKKAKGKRQQRSTVTSDQQKIWQVWQNANLNVQLDGELIAFGDQLYLRAVPMPNLGQIHIVRPGLHLGTFKKNRFEPSHSLATALAPTDFKCVIEVTAEEYRDYRHGLTLNRQNEAGKYHVLLTHQGKGFAIGHLVNGTIKNLYPKGLRQ